MTLLISVAPAGEGWVVRSDILPEALHFPTGGRAEQAARGLAGRNADQGREAVVRIQLRDGALGGVLSYPPRTAAEALAF